MNRSNARKAKVFGLTVCTLLFTLCSAEAQQTTKIWRIGYLDPSTASATQDLLDAFRQEMRKYGWTEGKNFLIEYRFAELKSERMSELAAELVRWKADVIVAAGGAPSAAKKVTATIPIVVASGIDLVQAGLAESLAKPGGNVTGLSILGRSSSPKDWRFSEKSFLNSLGSAFLCERGLVRVLDSSSKWRRSESPRRR